MVNSNYFEWWNLRCNLQITLTHYSLVLLFYTLWKNEKTFTFYVFREYIKATPGCNGLSVNIDLLTYFKQLHYFISMKNWRVTFAWIGLTQCTKPHLVKTYTTVEHAKQLLNLVPARTYSCVIRHHICVNLKAV